MTLYAIPDPKEQVLPAAENLFKALLLIAMLFASFYGADRLAAALDDIGNAAVNAPINAPVNAFIALAPVAAAALKWGTIALAAVVDVVLLTGMGVLAHDAVHRVLFRSAFWNEFWGGLLA